MGVEPDPPAPERTGGQQDRQPESYTWPMVAIVVAILPQVLVPAHDRVGPPSLIPLIEATAFLIMLIIAAKPGPVPRRFQPTILVLFSLLIVANAVSAGRLVVLVLSGGTVDGEALTATRLLTAATLVLVANVITFGLLYWELDGGGPAGRAAAAESYPDFQFPQTETAGLAAPGWRPRFADHLYVSFTTVVAFSPTDTNPLTIRAKALMAFQSLISLAVIVVVLARVINVLPATL